MMWYVSQDRKTEGPLSEERLAMLIHWGKITRRAYVCDEQLSGWVSIERTAFAPLLAAQSDDAAEPSAPRGLRGASLRFSNRALQRLGAVLAAAGMLAGALALVDGLANGPRTKEAASGEGSAQQAPAAGAPATPVD